MKKEKIQLEYILNNVSRLSLWNHLTTPFGLSSWFADKVNVNDNKYTFFWSKTGEEAELIYSKPETCVRYKWVNEEDTYFEFKIDKIELTGSIVLEITDFTEPSEQTDVINLWNTQIEELKRTLGI